MTADDQETETAWERLLYQLRRGRVTPFLGAGASVPFAPTGTGLARDWAAWSGYPLHDADNLNHVMSYVATEFGEQAFLKEVFLEDLRARTSAADYRVETQVHAALARLPLPIFATTNYDDFMGAALAHRGKQPVRAVSHWYEGADRDGLYIPDGYDPSVDRPLVFHLHGHCTHPPSIVLTEDDYIDYLVRLILEAGHAASGDVLPPVMREALLDRALLFVGYSLNDWNFRVLLRTLLHGIPDAQRRQHVSIQLPPPAPHVRSVKGRRQAEAAAKRFLARYFRAQRITVFWQSTECFVRELRQRLEA
jgi:hypothetical protein